MLIDRINDVFGCCGIPAELFTDKKRMECNVSLEGACNFTDSLNDRQIVFLPVLTVAELDNMLDL